MHRAALEGDLDEMLNYATAKRKAEVSALAGSPTQARLLSAMVPKTYRITGKTVAPRGRSPGKGL